ncbi:MULTISPECIES: glucosamine-6-phosphate deaminase [unclassified Pedobacter]|uniref:glucosamine-6-phosphate deaminase n=1 Tax=unclassified Pedobacter TaxID=2628915 RepID=UPI001DD09776|nr:MULTISPECIES: glucosamine-6-phosphate deaminase [unclassified Pedobacter]CAH0135395.1 Glucosamine-6-phosphate deaminase [Pedobacter sp. Bi126]CAH0223003.1 Glucosamine-6-phosphate deaminase [Pedobacter sp. Bi36]
MSLSIENTIDVRVYESRKTMGAAAAERFAREVDHLLSSKKEINVVFAAAPSQNEFLNCLYDCNLNWSKINAFHMDEYIGLASDAPQGFGNFLRERLFGKFKFKSVNYLNGNAQSLQAECMRYTELLAQYPVDIVCMGIGENGHLAFNDPPVADFNDIHAVKVVELDQDCRTQQVNDGCFEHIGQVPTHALTLTIPSLMKADFINCVVPGSAKAMAVKNTLEEQVDTKYPATVMQRHPNVVLFLDYESSSLLAKAWKITNRK